MPFEPEGFAKKIFDERYTLSPTETFKGACMRVAAHVAAAESNGSIPKWQDRFYQELLFNKFMPGGRTWYGAGRPKAQLLNCFVVPTHDNIEAWGDTTKEMMIITSLGGGVGINYSPLRYRGADLKGRGGHASGPLSLMKIHNATGSELETGGGRRMAMMMCLELTHPDIELFLDSKLEDGELSNCNISIVLNMPTDEFAAAVKTNGVIDLTFKGKKHGEIKARDFWNKLVANAWQNGEPGVLNGHLANQQNNIYYHSELVSTNPCGEIWLEPYGCCCLGAAVLPRFVHGGEFNWDEFEWTIRCGVRFLDNVLTVNHYPFFKIQENCENVRRIGLGVTGLHTMLLKLGLQYSSADGLAFVDKLFGFMKNAAYGYSIKLAIDKGPFAAWDPKMAESGFCKTLKPSIRRDIEEYGTRNCALLTIAPTGTTSLVCGTSSGIEPYVSPVSWRNYRKGDEQLRALVVEQAFVDHREVWEDVNTLEPRAHFEMQKVVQGHIDNAVSKTINLPNDYPVEDLAKIWLEYLPYMKGSTFYRDGSRSNQPIEPILPHEADKLIAEYNGNVLIEGANENQLDVECVNGICEVPSLDIPAVV